MAATYTRIEEDEETGPKGGGGLQPRCLLGAMQAAEEPWDETMEALIKAWRDASEGLAAAHNVAGKACKKKHVLYGLPSLMIPMVMAPLSAALKDVEWISYVEMCAFMGTAATSAMVQFFNFSGKTEKHLAFSARYADLVTDIDQEMAKPRQYRQQVDTFSLKIKMMYDALNRAAPDL
jgi:hypothetical protein